MSQDRTAEVSEAEIAARAGTRSHPARHLPGTLRARERGHRAVARLLRSEEGRPGVGKGEAVIVDTWWQNENGGFLCSTVPALHHMKPGSAGPGVPGIHPIIHDEVGNEVPPRSGRAGNICIKHAPPAARRIPIAGSLFAPVAVARFWGVIPFTDTIFLWQSMLLCAILIVVSTAIAWLSAPAPAHAVTAEKLGVEVQIEEPALPPRRSNLISKESRRFWDRLREAGGWFWLRSRLLPSCA